MNQPSGQVDVALVGAIAFTIYFLVVLFFVVLVVKLCQAIRARHSRKQPGVRRVGSEIRTARRVEGGAVVDALADRGVKRKPDMRTRKEFLTYMRNHHGGKRAGTGDLLLNEPMKYRYTRRQYIMTRSEREFYRKVFAVFGREYLIFPQVHLSTLFYHEKRGQSWQGALAMIQRKSVDYVLCDTEFRPVCAIELDDVSHQRPDRVERDSFVNSLFRNAGLPLARFSTEDTLTNDKLRVCVEASIAGH